MGTKKVYLNINANVQSKNSYLFKKLSTFPLKKKIITMEGHMCECLGRNTIRKINIDHVLIYTCNSRDW